MVSEIRTFGSLVILTLIWGTTAFAQALGPCSISCSPATRNGLFRESDVISIQTTNNSPITVTDLDGAIIYQGSPTSLRLTRGHYFVATDGDVSEFAVLPDDYAGAPFLGTEASATSDTNAVNAIQPTWIRMGRGSFWDDVQPQPNTWTWAMANQIIQDNATTGRKLIWTAFSRPTWQTNDLQFISLFTNYVGRVAQRYGSKLFAIEIWNEPWTTCAQLARLPNLDSPNQCMTDPQQMVRSYFAVLQAARTAVKSVAPNVAVIGPAWNTRHYAGTTDDLRQLGGTSLLDMMTFHDYDNGGAPPDQDVPFAGTTTVNTRVDECLDDFYSALQGTNLPLVVDEVGLYGQSAIGIPNTGDPVYLSGISWQRGMYRAVKLTEMYVAGGVKAVIPHVLGSSGIASSNLEVYGYEPGGRGPQPKTSAYLMTGYWLNNATLVDYRTLGGRVFLYAWQRPDNTSLLFAWTIEGETAAINPTPALITTDVFGRTNQVSALNEQPVLFHSNSGDAAALLQSVMSALVEWINLPPVFGPIGNQSVERDYTLQFTAVAVDPDHDPFTYSVTPLPAGASFDPAMGVLTWTPDAAQVGTYDFTFTATDNRGLSGSAETIVTVLSSPLDGLRAYWKFDEGAGLTTADAVGTADGTLSNFNFTSTSGWITGVNGNALRLDGIDDYISLNSGAPVLSNNFTIAAWVNPDNVAGYNAILSLHASYNASGLRIWINQSALLVEGETTNGWNYAWFALNSFTNGAWSHVAVEYDKSTIRAFVNGVEQQPALGSTVNWGGDFVTETNAPSAIGKADGGYFNGALDEIMVFDRTLSSSEVQSMFASNSVPTLARIGAQTVMAGTQLAFTLHATEASGDPLSYSATVLPSGATLDAGGAFGWTPNSLQVGNYIVNFSVSNGHASDSEEVSITVTQSDAKFTLKPIKPKRVRAGRRVSLSLSAKNPNHKALTYSMDPLPAGATFDSLKRKFIWATPNTTVGVYSLTASVTDGTNTDSKPVSISLY